MDLLQLFTQPVLGSKTVPKSYESSLPGFTPVGQSWSSISLRFPRSVIDDSGVQSADRFAASLM
jgi:hypothetical protein